VKAVTRRDNWGGGGGYIYPCSARLISFESDSAHAVVTGVKNNERFARAGKANVNGKRPLGIGCIHFMHGRIHRERVKMKSSKL
jgi:hypothetical protein